MTATREPDQTYPRRDQFEDEIDLIDYLRVMWKWKWLIIGGTILCIVAVTIYGYTRPVIKTYKISALIEIDLRAKLDPLDKIKSMIEYGVFNQQILNNLSNQQGASVPRSLAFEVAIPKGISILDIAYKTPDLDLGKAVMNTLIKRLEGEYKERIDQARYHFDETIKKKSESIKNIQSNIQRIKLTNDNKISGLQSKIKDIKANIQQIELGEGSKISRLQSKIKDIQANIQIIGKEFEKNKINKENAIRTHSANIEASEENIRVVKSTIEQMEKVFQEAQLTSEKSTAQREAIVLDSEDKRGHEDIFMQAAAVQQIINYPVILRSQINSLTFKEKEFSRKILSESNTIKDLQAQIQILEMQKDGSIQRQQDKIRDLEAQIQILEIQKSSSIQREQDNIGNLEAQIQLTELKADQNISVEENKITLLKSEIESLKRDRDKITGLIMKQPPSASLLPIKYKAKRNAVLAGAVGFFFLVFLAFFIEYIKNASKRTKEAL